MKELKEIVVQRGQEQVVEVRSRAGKLLFIKTRLGYELKCPRAKEIHIIPYEEILKDCLKFLPKDHFRQLWTENFLK